MTTKKHALLIFSKPPIPGMVKTRLTRERGGILSEQQAAEFFRRSLYDVSELCMHALIELQRENDARLAADPDADAVTYDFFVSTTPVDNVQAMRETYDAIGPWPMEVHYLTDAGATFDDHFDDAFSQLFALGYESVVSVGGDIPTLPKSAYHPGVPVARLLPVPRHAGLRAGAVPGMRHVASRLERATRPWTTRASTTTPDGRAALDAYVEKLKETDVPVGLPHAGSRCGRGRPTWPTPSRACAPSRRPRPHQADLFVPQRVLDWIDFMGFQVTTPPNDEPRPAPVHRLE